MNLTKAKTTLDEKFSFNADFLFAVVKEIGLKLSAKILDIGTGFGTMSIILALQGYHVITGEPEGHNWADWRENAKKISVEDLITFKFFRAEDLPFESRTFNALFCYTSLHHVSDKFTALKEFVRVTTDKGLIIIFELTSVGVHVVRQRLPSHPEAINPDDFTKNLSVIKKVKKSKYLNAFIYKKE